MVGGFDCGAGHAADHGVASHECLEGDGVEDFAAFGYGESFFGFDCGLDSVWPALEVCYSPFGCVDECDFAVADDVVDVADEEYVCVEGEVDLDEGGAYVVVVIE